MAMSGYFDASLRAVARSAPQSKLFISTRRGRSQAPFADEQFGWLTDRYTFAREPAFAELSPRLTAFDPDVLLICSWHIPAYRRVARSYAGRVPRVLCMDNVWRPTLRQRLGVLTRQFGIKPFFDFAWVSGTASAEFARRLGFSGDRILYGLNTCDYEAFAAARPLRSSASAPPRTFLYVGRLSPEKGIAQLAAAYRQYRSASPDPWPLLVCGTGPEGRWLEGIEGLRLTGFVQPAEMPELLAAAGCLVAPSLRETWSIAVHEAATAALPIIATTGCGATAHLVQDDYNGLVVDPGDPFQLAVAMRRFAALTDERRRTMGLRSAAMSAQFTPSRWAETALSITQRWAGL
jgi:glycosyltransferase involved in cell wall biosynthesis